jgi:DNA mismatch repair protein MutL
MPRIEVLPPETARLIAAGEVIERPASLLRELIDNAIDAGAGDIQVEIRGGGTDSVLVVDDGEGMDAEDLALSILPHATSKIRSADDLLTARSLGFRGEALASIAAVARLEITTSTKEMREARRLVSRPGTSPTLEATHGKKGTRVLVEGLFENYPARRQFLKRAQAEAALCRQVFADKALAHPDIGFRFVSEGRSLDQARPGEGLVARVLTFRSGPSAGLVYELRFSGEGFEGRVVLASPAWYRSDRRDMQVFVNRRRVQDFGLLSGLDYGFEGFLPGGAHPLAFLFVEVDPAQADFNIHPAKKEVRLRDPGSIRHAFTSSMRAFLGELVRTRPERNPQEGAPHAAPREPGLFAPGQGRSGSIDESPGAAGYDHNSYYRAEPQTGGRTGTGGGWDALLRERPFSAREALTPADPVVPGPAPRYLGTALGLFLVVERGEELYLIDQHAAHERLLFDELAAVAPRVQELLVPVIFAPESDAEDRRLAALAPTLAAAGFSLESAEGGTWMITAVPAPLGGDPEAALRKLLADCGKDPLRAVRAMTACKAAVKDGTVLEPEAALELALRAFTLPEPRCPHGRPVWIRLAREDLFRLVQRIV